jgi:hypothetical protein
MLSGEFQSSQRSEDDSESEDASPFEDLFRPPSEEEQEQEQEDEDTAPITQAEVDKFVRIELKQLDDAAYFRRHFG